MFLSLIAAADERGCIGKHNQLPWKLAGDLQYFRAVTKGKTVIMGRKTYESIGRPLPDRRNIVVTRNRMIQILGCEIIYSFQDALDLTQSDDEVFVIGGGEIYNQAIEYADRILLTRVHTTIDGGDAFFPPIDETKWREVSKKEFQADSDNEYAYDLLELTKI